MFCSSCGSDMPDHFRFCSQCGAPARGGRVSTAVTFPLRRSREDRKIAGVCAGLARHLNLDPTLIRVVMLVSAIWGFGIVLYLVCWAVMPIDPRMLPPVSVQPVINTPVRL